MWDTLTIEQCEELGCNGYVLVINGGTMTVEKEKAPHQLVD